ncbi:uncharacterized protein [Arachis hypogaea]|uniref:uncharacterized protein n=1 Tax=Arachis hypogaea TaxID=3818 RepID=UPI003B21C498
MRRIMLLLLRQRTPWKEIVCPGVTCFVTVFITLKNIFEHKADLQALVVDAHFTGHKLKRSASDRVVHAIILDNKFWDDCFTAYKLVNPLTKLMRIVNADDKPSLRYVYEGTMRAENAIKEMFKHTYFLNPAFFFDENYKEAPDAMRGLLDLVILHCKVNNFDKPEVFRAAKNLQPSKNICLIFASLAKHLFLRGVKGIGVFFLSNSYKRSNRLEHDRLNDIVYVTYNLHLKSRKRRQKRKQKVQYDLIDYESVNLVDFWVTEEVVEKEPDLPSNIEDLLHDIDADLDQSGGGGRRRDSSPTFYAGPLDFSGPSSRNEGNDINETNLQQVITDFDN